MNKFEDLIERFEGLLDRFEGDGADELKNAAPRAKRATPPKKAGGAPADDIPENIQWWRDNIDAKLDGFKTLGDQVDQKDIAAMTADSIEIIRLAGKIFHAISISKKDKLENFAQVAYGPIQPLVGKVSAHKKTIPRDFMNHAKAVAEGIQVCQFFVAPTPLSYAKDQIDQMDFCGNRVLTCGVPAQVAWYKGFKEIILAVRDFVKENAAGEIPMKMKGDDFKTNFDKLVTGSSGDKKEEEKKEEPEKPKSKSPETKRAAAPKKEEPKKREAKKEKFNNLWQISDYEGETITFEGNDVKNVTAFNILNCNKTNIIVKGKCKSIMIEGS